MSTLRFTLNIVTLVAVAAMSFGVFTASAVAQPTPTINYQGKLTDNTGVAVADGTYNMRFWLLQSTVQATTSAIWTESLTGANQVQVTNGLFSVMLGSTSALTSVDFNQPLWLGVEIGGTGATAWDGEMSPRKPLGTVPAAFESFQLGGVASSSFLRSDQADTASGLLTFTSGFISSASSSITNLMFGNATGTSITINNEYFTDLTGAGLQNTAGVLSVATNTLKLAISDTTGTLSVSRGGTGSTTPTGFLFGDGAGALNSTNTISSAYIADAYLRNNADDYTSGLLTIGGGFIVQASSTITGDFRVGVSSGGPDFAINTTGNTITIGTTTASSSARRTTVAFNNTKTSFVPSSPIGVGSIVDGAGGADELLGAYDIAVAGDYAYVASFSDGGVQVLDISDPTNPVGVGSITDGANGADRLNAAASIAVEGNYAYIASFFDGVQVLDISDPTNPRGVGSITDGASGADRLSGPIGIAVAGNYAYVTSNTENGVQVLDISDPTNPRGVGSITDGASGADELLGATGITIAGNYAYITGSDDNGVQVLDISDPTNPIGVGSITDGASGADELLGARNISISGNYAYVAGFDDNGVQVLDISDPTNPIGVGSITDGASGADELAGAHIVVVVGNYAYVSGSVDSGVQILDISSSTNPIGIGSITDGVSGSNTLAGARGMAVSGNYAYVTSNTENGVQVLDLGGLEAPTAEIGNLLANSIGTDFARISQLLSIDGALNVGRNALIGGALTITGTASSTLQSANTNPALVVMSGNVGIGTSSPMAKLSVVGNIYASTTATSTFTHAIRSTCFTVDGSTCITTGGTSVQNWLIASGALTPSTTLGIRINASSTIGNGTATGGLTIDGNATTTGIIISQGTGTSTFAGGLEADQLNITAGTSTFANGIQLAAGCFRDASGSCIKDAGDTVVTVAANDSTAAEKAAADYVADGTADEATIQAAIDYAYNSGTGGKVYLLSGQFNIADQIDLATSTALIGQGSSTRLRLINSAPDNIAVLSANRAHGTYVGYLHLEGNRANNINDNQNGITFSNTASSTIEYVSANSFQDYGIYLSGLNTSGNRVQYSNILDNEDFGIVFDLGSNQNNISGNNISQNGSYGMYLVSAERNFITDNIINSNQSDGIRLFVNSDGNIFESNRVANSASNAISMSNSDDNKFIGNILVGSVDDGVILESGSDNNTFIGNTISSGGGDGVYISSSQYNVFETNSIQQNTNRGFYLNGFSSGYTVISNNVISLNTDEAIYIVSSPLTNISGNSIRGNGAGLYMTGSGNYATVVSGNTFMSNTGRAIETGTASDDIAITGNMIHTNGGGASTSVLIAGENTSFTGNFIETTGSVALVTIAATAIDTSISNNDFQNSSLDDATFISDSGTGTRYDQWNRSTLTTNTGVGYNLFNITGSSSVALAALDQLGTGNALTVGVSGTDYFTIGNNGRINASSTATSTFANGINLYGGCFAVNGTCIGGGASTLASLTDTDTTNAVYGSLLRYTGSTWATTSTSTLGLGDGSFLGLSDTQSSLTANRIIFTNSTGNQLTDSSALTYTGTELGVGGDVDTSSSTGLSGYRINGTVALVASTTLDNFFLAGSAPTSFTNAAIYNYAFGSNAMKNLSTGNWNLAFGGNALRSCDFFSVCEDTSLTGSNNIAIGNETLVSNTSGSNNFAGGLQTLAGNTTGSNNIAIGGNAIGSSALRVNTTGSGNLALGIGGLRANTIGSYNTALGYRVLYANTTGSYNTAIGFQALDSNTGTGTIAIGYNAAENATGVDRGIFIGYDIDAFSTTQDDVLNIGNLIFGTGVDGTGTNYSSGNIGIGTSTPYTKFAVAGSISATGTITTFENATNTFAGALAVDGTGTSTFANGIQLAAGCFRDASGSCIKSSGDTVVTVAANDTPANEKAYADYVADGTDDEVQIQAAIDALPSTGGSVYLLAGTFNVGTTTYADRAISINASNTALIGQGPSTILRLQNSSNGSVSIIDVTYQDSVVIRDLQIDGNQDNNAAAGTYYGIELNNTGSSTIENVIVKEMQDSAVSLNLSDENLIQGNIFRGNSGNNIRFQTSNENIISNNTIITRGNAGGIEVRDSDYNIISGNNIDASSGSSNPVTVHFSSNHNVVDGNVIFGGSEGIRIYGGGLSQYNVISNNKISSTTDEGINLGVNADDNLVTGNSIYLSGTIGIDLDNADRNVVSGNFIHSAATYGISVDQDWNSVTDNTIINNDSAVYAIIIASGANETHVAGNRYEGTVGSLGISDAASDTIYDQWNRETLLTTNTVGYNLFNITGSTSVALAALDQLGTGNALTVGVAGTDYFTIGNNGRINASSTATSTFAAGINIDSGCFAIAGACLTTGVGTNGFQTSGGNTILTNIGDSVGIGTTTPNYKLTVAGDTNIDDRWSTLPGYRINGVAAVTASTSLNNWFFAGSAPASFTSAATYNYGIGNAVLSSLTTGDNNVAIGRSSLNSITTGSSNIAFGSGAMQFNTTGFNNIAMGEATLQSNTVGWDNIALGYAAMENGSAGSYNTALGRLALNLNTGTGTIAIGYQAADNATAVDRGIFIGYDIDAFSTTQDDVLNIGNLIFGTGVDGTGTTYSSGNIGIGTSTPYTKLAVAGSISATGTITTFENATNTFAGALAVDGTGTSTFANGIQLAAGCFRDASGSCIKTAGDTVVTVAANDSSAAEKAYADYIADGTADEATIQAAIDYAYNSGTGGTVHLLAGTFNVGTTTYATRVINLATSSKLVGQGSSTRLVLDANSGNNISILSANYAHGTYVGHLHLEGNKANNTNDNQNGITFTNTASSSIEYVIANDFQDNGIELTGTQAVNNTVSYLSANNSEDFGLYLANANYNTFNNLTLRENQVHGVYVLSSNNNTFTNVTASNNGSVGFYLESASYNRLTGGVMEGQDTGFYLESAANYNRIESIHIANNSSRGYTIDNSNFNVISNLTMEDTGSYGGYITASDQNTFTGGTYSGASFTGIWLENGSDNNTISGVVFEDYLEGIAFGGGSSNVITGNTFFENRDEGVLFFSGTNQSNSIVGNSFINNGFGNDSQIESNGALDTLISNNSFVATSTVAMIDLNDTDSQRTVIANNTYSNPDTATYITDNGVGTRYNDFDRRTILTETSRGYNLFSIIGSSSVALASTTQLGTGDLLSLNNSSGNVVTVTNSGNFGIGTTTPNYKLTVAGDTNIDDRWSTLPGYRINGVAAVTASTSLNNWFLAGATSTSFNNEATYNYAIGEGALKYLLGGGEGAGGNNFAAGQNALRGSSTAFMNGTDNVAIGRNALLENAGGGNNIALGVDSLRGNEDGENNVALGLQALYTNTSGSYNNAIGWDALYFNTTGLFNNAFGHSALNSNTTGSHNIGIGRLALGSNTAGSYNVAVGRFALDSNNGTGTIAIGYNAAENATGVDRGIFIGYDIDAFSTTQDDVLNIGNLIFGTGVDGTGTTISTGNIGIGTTTAAARLSINKTGVSGAGIVGLDQYLGTANSVENAVQYGNRFYLDAANTATTTIVGSMLRLEDGTTYGNTVRGLEVQTNRGSNTQGENTALSGFARTFGVRAVTSADAGGSFEPAAGFFETEGTTQGNAVRGYSDSITTASLLALFQASSTFAGTGLEMSFGNSGGSFSSTTSKYLDFQNANNSVFTVSAFGTTTIGRNDGNTTNLAGLLIPFGGICVDNDGTCTASTSGTISAVDYDTGNSDLAETYFSDDDLETGELVQLVGQLSVDRATKDSDMPILGIVSTKPGLTLGFDDRSLTEGETKYPIALTGRVPVQLSTENGPIKAGDQLMLSSLPGIAMKATGTGATIGIALEDFDDTRMYSDTFINQFGDDMVDPVYDEINSTLDPRIKDSCYYSGGEAIGESPCIPLSATTTQGQIDEANDIQERESVAEQLEELRQTRATTEYLEDGTRVKVGQIVVFVQNGYRWVDDRQLAGIQALMGTSSITEIGDNEQETVFDRLVALANSFVDGILSIFELRADRIEVAEELCVDGVCIDAETLRALIDGTQTEAEYPTEVPDQNDTTTEYNEDKDTDNSQNDDTEGSAGEDQATTTDQAASSTESGTETSTSTGESTVGEDNTTTETNDDNTIEEGTEEESDEIGDEEPVENTDEEEVAPEEPTEEEVTDPASEKPEEEPTAENESDTGT